MSNYYPMFLKLDNKKCIVIGGGKVAQRKVNLLLEAKTSVEVISPVMTEYLEKLAKTGKIKHINRIYQEGDIEGAFLVIAATNSPEINRRVYNECKKLNIKVNVIDNPDLCDFIVPSAIKRGPLTITVSTDGNSPALAKKIKTEIEQIYGEEYGKFADLLGKLRQRIQSEIEEEKNRKKFWERLFQYDIPGLLKAGREKEVEEIIEKCLLCS